MGTLTFRGSPIAPLDLSMGYPYLKKFQQCSASSFKTQTKQKPSKSLAHWCINCKVCYSHIINLLIVKAIMTSHHNMIYCIDELTCGSNVFSQGNQKCFCSSLPVDALLKKKFPTLRKTHRHFLTPIPDQKISDLRNNKHPVN